MLSINCKSSYNYLRLPFLAVPLQSQRNKVGVVQLEEEEEAVSMFSETGSGWIDCRLSVSSSNSCNRSLALTRYYRLLKFSLSLLLHLKLQLTFAFQEIFWRVFFSSTLHMIFLTTFLTLQRLVGGSSI